jgi:hypothetical protein
MLSDVPLVRTLFYLWPGGDILHLFGHAAAKLPDGVGFGCLLFFLAVCNVFSGGKAADQLLPGGTIRRRRPGHVVPQ